MKTVLQGELKGLIDEIRDGIIKSVEIPSGAIINTRSVGDRSYIICSVPEQGECYEFVGIKNGKKEIYDPLKGLDEAYIVYENAIYPIGINVLTEEIKRQKELNFIRSYHFGLNCVYENIQRIHDKRNASLLDYASAFMPSENEDELTRAYILYCFELAKVREAKQEAGLKREAMLEKGIQHTYKSNKTEADT